LITFVLSADGDRYGHIYDGNDLVYTGDVSGELNLANITNMIYQIIVLTNDEERQIIDQYKETLSALFNLICESRITEHQTRVNTLTHELNQEKETLSMFVNHRNSQN
jgi:hypothetical protein